MRRKLSIFGMVMVFLILAACGGQPGAPPVDQASDSGTAGNVPEGSTSASNAPQRMSAGANSFVAIREVGLGPEGYVAFENFTDVPVSMEGTYLCQGDACSALPDAVIEPGEIGIVAVGRGSGLGNVIASNANVGELRPADGEIALFVSETVSADELLNYLQWGSTPHELTEIAIEAGLWREGSYAPASETATRLYRVEESGLWLFEAP